MCGYETPHDRVYTREHRKSTHVNQVGQAELAKAPKGKKNGEIPSSLIL